MTVSTYHVDNFYSKLKAIHPTIRAIGRYVDSRTTPILFKCLVCKHTWYNKPGQVVSQRKSGCPRCSVERVTTLGLETRLREQEARVVGWLAGTTTKVVGRVDSMTFKLKCSVCNREWDALINSIRTYKRSGCRSCVSAAVGMETKRDTIRRVLESDSRFKSLILMDNGNDVKCKCATCNGTWVTTVGSIKKGSACPACGIRRALKSPKRNPKIIKIGRHEFECTGYEPQAIEYLVYERKVPPKEISTCVPIFSYTYTGEKRKYTPDLLVGGEYVIEVKSEFSFGCAGNAFGVNVLAKNKAKCRAVEKAGYQFRMIVVRVTGRHQDKVSVMMLPVGWQNIPARTLRKLVKTELYNISRS